MDTAGSVERLGTLQSLIYVPVVRSKLCPTPSNPVLLPSRMVACLSFTLLMMLLLPGWPTMGINRIRNKKNPHNAGDLGGLVYTLCLKKLGTRIMPHNSRRNRALW